jgi:hypothetical protein
LKRSVEGRTDNNAVGAAVGIIVGSAEGRKVGINDGITVGFLVVVGENDADGHKKGVGGNVFLLGEDDGFADGREKGWEDG